MATPIRKESGRKPTGLVPPYKGTHAQTAKPPASVHRELYISPEPRRIAASRVQTRKHTHRTDSFAVSPIASSGEEPAVYDPVRIIPGIPTPRRGPRAACSATGIPTLVGLIFCFREPILRAPFICLITSRRRALTEPPGQNGQHTDDKTLWTQTR